MGRPRKSTALKILDGDQRCRVNRNEPKPPKHAGECPAFLDEVGRAAWHRVAAGLDAMGLLTVADSEAIALYAATYSRWRAASDSLERDGTTITSTTETPTKHGLATRTIAKTNPALAVANECQRQMIRLLAQFGMTPTSRSSLDVEVKAKDDRMLAIIQRKKGRKGGP